MRTLKLLLLLLPFVASCVTPTKAELDDEVRRLCAADGGVKVYQKVELPPTMFDSRGDVIFYDATKKERSLGAEYTFRQSVTYYRKGDPDAGTGQAVMARRHYQIIRNSDQRLLGEAVLYGRRGGDLTGPGHPSAFSCPSANDAGDVALIRRVFVVAR
jgi:hypothetical protein